MTIYRIQKQDNYAVIDSRPLRNPNLTAKAKGLLAYLLQLPNDWQIYESELTNHFVDGIRSIKTGIKELMGAGHIRRYQRFNAQHRFAGYEYLVAENPDDLPEDEQIPLLQNALTENALTENVTLLSINQTKHLPNQVLSTTIPDNPSQSNGKETFEDYVEVMRGKFADLDINEELEKFNTYYQDKKWTKPGPHKLAFRNWLDKSMRHRNNGGSNRLLERHNLPSQSDLEKAFSEV